MKRGPINFRAAICKSHFLLLIDKFKVIYKKTVCEQELHSKIKCSILLFMEVSKLGESQARVSVVSIVSLKFL